MKTALNYFKAFILFFIPKKFKTKSKQNEKSKPYIIKVKNTSEEDLTDVTILGTLNLAQGSLLGNNKYFDKSGNYVEKYQGGNLVISSGFSTISYIEILYQFMNKPFEVGLTYMSSNNQRQILQNISLISTDANGSQSTENIIPIIDPYQTQTDKLTMKTPFIVDCQQKIVLSNLKSKTEVDFYLFPSKVAFNPFFKEELEKSTLFSRFIKWLQTRTTNRKFNF